MKEISRASCGTPASIHIPTGLPPPSSGIQRTPCPAPPIRCSTCTGWTRCVRRRNILLLPLACKIKTWRISRSTTGPGQPTLDRVCGGTPGRGRRLSCPIARITVATGGSEGGCWRDRGGRAHYAVGETRGAGVTMAVENIVRVTAGEKSTSLRRAEVLRCPWRDGHALTAQELWWWSHRCGCG